MKKIYTCILVAMIFLSACAEVPLKNYEIILTTGEHIQIKQADCVSFSQSGGLFAQQSQILKVTCRAHRVEVFSGMATAIFETP